MAMPFRLEDRAVIAISGPEAQSFLQGLVTNDVSNIGPSRLRYAALLTPQGKILFDFLIGEREETLFLDVATASRDALAKRLSMYRLRARVEVSPRDDLAVAWSQDAEAPFIRDPRHPGLGCRAILAAAAAPEAQGAGRFEVLRLACSVPESRDFGQDRMFALDSDLDELGGIAFDKGCYVGQELTARMKHRSTARKRLLPVVASDAALPAAGTPINAGSHEVGSLSSVYGTRGFAIVRLDRLEEARDTALRAADVAVRLVRPDWLFA
jgi:folate-binding protein YgfZ